MCSRMLRAEQMFNVNFCSSRIYPHPKLTCDRININKKADKIESQLHIPVKCLIFGFFINPVSFTISSELTPCRSSCIVELNVCFDVTPALRADDVEEKFRIIWGVAVRSWRRSSAEDIVVFVAVGNDEESVGICHTFVSRLLIYLTTF